MMINNTLQVATIKALRVEEKYDLVSTCGVAGYVRRKGRSDFVLVASNNQERSCWGNLTEILLDIEYFIENDTLRPAKGPRW